MMQYLSELQVLKIWRADIPEVIEISSKDMVPIYQINQLGVSRCLCSYYCDCLRCVHQGEFHATLPRPHGKLQHVTRPGNGSKCSLVLCSGTEEHCWTAGSYTVVAFDYGITFEAEHCSHRWYDSHVTVSQSSRRVSSVWMAAARCPTPLCVTACTTVMTEVMRASTLVTMCSNDAHAPGQHSLILCLRSLLTFAE